MKRLIMILALAVSGFSTAEPANPPKRSVADVMEEADMFMGERRFGAARRRYYEAAELMRAADQLPTAPLRRIANAYYFEGRVPEARQTLVRLAEEAAAFGDVLVQAEALADAAYLAGRLGSKPEFEQNVRALRRILASRYLPEEQSRRLRKRLQ